ncbi:TetR/AcrR family transcriptional regulator [Frankia tisae]|uniref:TetR/AcrR family transcriptional regulator n=1 Tax=Frankia tisae TaxID=2950104 RepID=UPI0021BED602|nr:TetR/AcrR family transcriptional regulator [Frankia tisae]
MAEQVGPPRPRPGTELPLLGDLVVERADAARNRAAILEAARCLVATEGVFSVEDVARAAGVGVGTIYRRFGDRAGLVYAVVGLFELELQKRFVYGPPPLGPGAPPAERLRAFLHARVDAVETQRALLVSAETSSPTVRYETGAYTFHRVHLVYLIGQIKPRANAAYVADALLAAVAATLITYQRTYRGYSVAGIKAGIDDLLDLVLCGR